MWVVELEEKNNTEEVCDHMLLAEALAERAEAQNRLLRLTERLKAVARIQEGDIPDEDPQELLDEVAVLYTKVEDLIRRINATNTATMFDDELTLTDAIAKRDVALQRRRFYTNLADAAGTRQDRFSRSEIKYVSTVDVSDLRAKADQAAKDYRLLDTRIQQLNWSTELQTS